MVAKYKIYAENGNKQYSYEFNGIKGGGSIERLKSQLIYDMRNGIASKIDGITLMPEVVIENSEDIYNYFFKNTKNETVSLTDYLYGMITTKGGRCDGRGCSSMMMHNKECRFTNDRLSGGLPVSNEKLEKIDSICKKYCA